MDRRSRPDAARWIEFDHTADVGFEIEAETLEDLFHAAAAGVCRVLGLPSEEAAGEGGAERILLERPDMERLLVAWLREIIVRAHVDGVVPEVERIEVREAAAGTGAPSTLDATVRWRPSRGPTREVKAVTYHGLQVERTETGWRARVILDV